MSFVNKTNHQYIQGRVASREGVRCQAGGAHDYDRDILKSSYGFTQAGANLASELKGSYAPITSGVTRHNQCGGKKKKRKSRKNKKKKKSRKKKRKRTRKGGTWRIPSMPSMPSMSKGMDGMSNARDMVNRRVTKARDRMKEMGTNRAKLLQRTNPSLYKKLHAAGIGLATTGATFVAGTVMVTMAPAIAIMIVAQSLAMAARHGNPFVIAVGLAFAATVGVAGPVILGPLLPFLAAGAGVGMAGEEIGFGPSVAVAKAKRLKEIIRTKFKAKVDAIISGEANNNPAILTKEIIDEVIDESVPSSAAGDLKQNAALKISENQGAINAKIGELEAAHGNLLNKTEGEQTAAVQAVQQQAVVAEKEKTAEANTSAAQAQVIVQSDSAAAESLEGGRRKTKRRRKSRKKKRKSRKNKRKSRRKKTKKRRRKTYRGGNCNYKSRKFDVESLSKYNKHGGAYSQYGSNEPNSPTYSFEPTTTKPWALGPGNFKRTVNKF